MKLTKTQRKLLQFYMQHQTIAPTVPSVLRAFGFSWGVLVLLAAASTWFIRAGWSPVAWVFIGICAGAFLRDVGRIRILFRTWPVIHSVLDWQRVQELLLSDDALG